jgi:UDP-N-acetylmuramyl pentapeptide phosphotransferase/UDP-N-acetylglucosamine-1-phosphate transferase
MPGAKRMLPTAGDLLLFAAAFALPCIVFLGFMPKYLELLRSRGRLATDVHKPELTKVPTPAGPLMIVAIVVGEAAIYLVNHSTIPLVAIEVTLVAGLIGLYDDLRGLGGIVKPALLTLAAVPLLVEEQVHHSLYTAVLNFPVFGATGTHFIIFAILIVAAMPVSANAFNMLDAFNGEISGFTIIVSVALAVGIVMAGVASSSFDYIRLAAVMPLAATAACFYYYNRFPARAFDGDSGSLTFGALYAALAIMGGVEVAALVALVPAVLNSYYILYSMRGFVEHKQMELRPTYLGDDGKLHATEKPKAPTTLVRMIVLGSPMGEREIVQGVLTLTVFACALSILTSALTWFR